MTPPPASERRECATASGAGRRAIADALCDLNVEFAGQAGPPVFTDNREANDLILNDPMAFLLACLFDQGMNAEKVCEIPWRLKSRLGHLDASLASEMTLRGASSFEKTVGPWRPSVPWSRTSTTGGRRSRTRRPTKGAWTSSR